jgi:hypothetical protein
MLIHSIIIIIIIIILWKELITDSDYGESVSNDLEVLHRRHVGL